MDDGEFLRLLERYPVVRKKTHCRVQWNDMNTNQCSSRANTWPMDWVLGLQYDDEPAATQPASSGIFLTTGQESKIELTDSLEDAIEKFLAPYFSSSETAKVHQELEKLLQDFVSGLNLENVNDLCAQFNPQ
ncbi:hypothetical protein CCR75_000186 [Bremia lactucae]|uniref:Uncharacterized protein n=1 Tax=Bremia lactucae TaxID=4779 RepID=A0A976FPB6_BRELC|nr:hypothetical protein CCR75_000186 [Bremia lactucae]